MSLLIDVPFAFCLLPFAFCRYSKCARSTRIAPEWLRNAGAVLEQPSGGDGGGEAAADEAPPPVVFAQATREVTEMCVCTRNEFK